MRSYITLFVGVLFHSVTSVGQTSWRIVKQELIFNNPPFAHCHASTIVELTPKKLAVAYFAGSDEGNNDVGIWLSIQENGKWNQPVLVADGIINDTLRYPCWNPVLFKRTGGKVFLFYKVGPSPREWWGMVSASTNNGKTWATPEKLPGGILGPIKNKPVQLPGGIILSPSSTETKESWKVHIEISADLGKSWQLIPVDPETAFNVIQPSILLYGENKLQMLCRSKEDKIIEAYSYDNGKTWGALSETSLPNPNSGIDAVTLSNGIQLLVYNPTKSKESFNERAKLNVAMSKDGKQWTDIAVLENGTKKEFSYPAVIQTKDGKVHITYTYDRNNIKHVVLDAGKL